MRPPDDKSGGSPREWTVFCVSPVLKLTSSLACNFPVTLPRYTAEQWNTLPLI